MTSRGPAGRRKASALTGFAALGFGILAILWQPAALRDVRELLFDSFQRLSPRPYDASLPVRVVDIDDAALAGIGQWPWPREQLADLVDRLAGLGASAIALDLVLAEGDRLSNENIVRLFPEGRLREEAAATLAIRGVTGDLRLGQALAAAPSVGGLVLTGAGVAPRILASFATAGDDPVPFVPAFDGAILPIEPVAASVKGLGALNFLPDRDLVVRRIPAVLRVGRTLTPSLAIEALRVAQGASTILVRASGASGELVFGSPTGITAVRVGDIVIPTEADGAVRIRYAGTHPERRISAARVLSGEVDRAGIEGRIVLIGATAAGLSDLRASPLESAIPGVDTHAEFLEHALSGARLHRPDYAVGAEVALTVAIGIMAVSGALALPPLGAGLTGLLALIAIAATSWLSFARADVLIDPVGPGVATLMAFLAAAVSVWRTADQDRRAVADALGRYVSPVVVARLAADRSALKLGGETREITVLFADIRGFTARSETMTAEESFAFLNTVHTPLTQAILDSGGTIDKYLGDGVMAFWNAPLDQRDHAARACRACLRLAALVPDIAAKIEPKNSSSVVRPPLAIGIGLNTGPAHIGNVGSILRFDYSAIGDTVNVAARLEPLSKTYGVALIAAETVVTAAPDLIFLPLDFVRLRGKTTPTRIYALHGERTDPAACDLERAHVSVFAAVTTSGSDIDARRETLDAIEALSLRPDAAVYASVYRTWRERLERSDNTA